jgi:hypothetical protein
MALELLAIENKLPLMREGACIIREDDGSF